MSVFDGVIDFRTTYMVDFPKKSIPFPKRLKGNCDNCLVVGLSRDALKPKDVPRKSPDVLCPLEPEYYKNAVQRFAVEYPTLTERYMSGDVDPTPIENQVKDRSRSEYLVEYCPREMPFMSVNLTRRARALQTLRLPDDVAIPATITAGSYRHPPADKYLEPPASMSMRPKYDDKLTKELRKILRVTTGETQYEITHGLLGKVVLEKNPFGPPREEPKYGKYRTPSVYTYYI